MAILHGLLQLLIVTAQSVQILADILKELVEVVAQIEALVVIGHARLIVIQQLPKKKSRGDQHENVPNAKNNGYCSPAFADSGNPAQRTPDRQLSELASAPTDSTC